MIKKGIILAGGTGTRLSPLTKSVNKQLLPIHDKPMIFYPLSVMMLANIKKILMIVNPGQINNFKSLLGDGSRYGININYKIQDKPRGLPDAFILGKTFINKDNVALILGDNFFYGQSLTKKLENGFFGFSTIFFILFFLISAIPYWEGLFTGYKKTFAPFFNFVHFFNFSVRHYT